ncbi:hypothetical protein BGZ80_009431 [Entomortierella chlamydospora]|uniref:Uncharacterized protein n=1 Tax=Entomortierella chlamydospora TaxID=101097 RepID=A0A9P6MW96_9FUNG|nr:hypothetical protein BGZ80_009431 [Entomortierella chlamydospora]
MKSIILLAAVAISTVAAQADEGRLYYTEPVSATVWVAGKTQTVSWSNVCKSENTGDLDITLYLGTGGKNGTEQVRVPNIPAIGKLNCLKSKTATVVLPANLTTSDKYAIHVNTEPLQSYSSPFTIKGIDPVTTATAAPTNATTATTVATTTATPTNATTPSTSTSANPNSTSDKPNAAGSHKTLGSSAVALAAAIGYMLL